MLFLERKRDFERPLKVINTSFDIALNVPIKNIQNGMVVLR